MENLFSKKPIALVIFVLLLYSAVAATINLFYTSEIGYIDTAVLMEKYPAAIEAREKLKLKTDEWQKNTQTLETELTELNNEMIEKGANWNKSALSQKQEVFKKKQNEYYKYRQAIQEKAAKLEQELFQPVYADINAKITDFGKDKDYSMILGTLSGGNILYADKVTDLTEEFLSTMVGK